MNKLFKAVSGVVAGVALAVGISLAGTSVIKTVYADAPGQVGNAPRCSVNYIGQNDQMNINDKRDKATARFKLGGASNCKVRLSVNSFYAPTWNGMSGDGSYKDQTLFDRMTYTFSKDNSEHALSVGLPTSSNSNKGCFWQVDLTYGVENVRPVLAYDHGRIDGGECAPTPPVVIPPVVTPPVTPPEPTHSYACNSLSATQSGARGILITDYPLSFQNVTPTGTVINWGDGTTTNVAPAPAGSVVNQTHQYAEYKSYTVSATSSFTYTTQAGVVTNVTSNPCVTQIAFTPNKIQVCELSTKTIININENDFDAAKHSKNLADCTPAPEKIYVCELSTKTIITINENEFDAAKHTKDLTKCAPVNQIKVCELSTKTIITINENEFDAAKHSLDLSKCVVTKIQVCEIATHKVTTINEADFGNANYPTDKFTKDLTKCAVTPPVTPPTAKTLVNTGAGSMVALAGATSLVAAAAHALWRRQNA